MRSPTNYNFVSHYTTNTPIEVLWPSFKSFCLECLHLMPHKFHKMSCTHPWINSHIKRLANKKRRLYNKARQSSLPSDWDIYRNFKSYIQKECRRAHDSYVSNLFSSTKSDNNKRFWSYIKSKRNEQCGVPTLECNNQLFTDNVTKANILNDHFSSVFVANLSIFSVTCYRVFPRAPSWAHYCF